MRVMYVPVLIIAVMILTAATSLYVASQQVNGLVSTRQTVSPSTVAERVSAPPNSTTNHAQESYLGTVLNQPVTSNATTAVTSVAQLVIVPQNPTTNSTTDHNSTLDATIVAAISCLGVGLVMLVVVLRKRRNR
jgi:hypothetical protein